MAAAEEVADHDAVAVGRARGGAGSAWAAGSAVRAEVGSGDRPGGDAGGGERPQGDLALGSPAAAGSAAAVWNRERALSLPRHLSLLLPVSRRGGPGGDARALRPRRDEGRAHRARRQDAEGQPPARRRTAARALGLRDRARGVIGDLVVPPEANEITAALTLLKGLPLEGALVTGDAIFTQREICRHVRDAEGHYLFVVKTNQPELHRDIAIAFGDASPL